MRLELKHHEVTLGLTSIQCTLYHENETIDFYYQPGEGIVPEQFHGGRWERLSYEEKAEVLWRARGRPSPHVYWH